PPPSPPARPPRTTLLPYTTLFRSWIHPRSRHLREHGKTVPPLQVLSFCSAACGPKQALPADRNRLCLRTGTGSACGSEQAEPVSDRKSTRLNSSHVSMSSAVFCLK